MSTDQPVSSDPATSADLDDERPDVGDIPTRPASPAVIRFLGCQAEMAGLSTDYFTVGRTDDCDLRLPDELGGGPAVLLRFSRGAEGWRVSPADNQAVFVNQEQVRGLTPLRSGDVLRFAPGGAGMQFNIVHQNATPLANLVAKHAPRLLSGDTHAPTAARDDDSLTTSAAPLRYEAGGETKRPAAPAAPLVEPARKLDPALLVAGSILLAGVIAGAAFLFSANGSAGLDTATTPAPAPSVPIEIPDATKPDITTPDGTPVEPLADTPVVEEPTPKPSPESPPRVEATPEPQPETPPPTDPEELIEELIEDPFG